MKQINTREKLISFYVSPDEEEMINRKMAAACVTNLSAYLRKMAIDGIVVRLDDQEIKELVSLLGSVRDRIDQIAGRMETEGRTNPDDLNDVRADQKRLIELANSILFRLAAIR